MRELANYAPLTSPHSPKWGHPRGNVNQVQTSSEGPVNASQSVPEPPILVLHPKRNPSQNRLEPTDTQP